MNKAVFLDRDGTIIEDAHYLSDPDKIKFFPGVIRGLKELQDFGFHIFIVTNQSGIGRGYFKESQLKKIHERLLMVLEKEQVKITKIYYAPYYEKSKIARYRKNEFLRKPNIGMILEAQKEFNISLAHSYMIGDKETDIGAGLNAGLKSNILVNGEKKTDFEKACDWIVDYELKEGNILSAVYLEKTIKELKKKKKKIVTTNGVFDLLHIGHIRYLNECKEFGDVLVVGINADHSVKKNKGDLRPINHQLARAEVISQLKSVDYTFIFHEKDPREFLKIVKPDVHVKGSDYSMDKIVERDIVEQNRGTVKLVKFIQGYSTTSMMNKIKGIK